MTDAPVPAPDRRDPAWRALRWILIAQIAVAVLLVGLDLNRLLPQMLSPSNAPGLDSPAGPGDQVRRYAPAQMPLRQPEPGTRPMLPTTDMPSRLAFEATDFDGAPVLTLTGTIAPGDAARFADFMATASTVPDRVFLNSSGGSVSDALAIGRALRDMEVETVVTGTDVCLSACPYLLAAGTERRADAGAMIGVHQHFFGENTVLPAFIAVENIQRGQGEVMRYLDEMGVDPLVMRHALVTPPNEIYLLTPEERATYRLTTGAG